MDITEHYKRHPWPENSYWLGTETQEQFLARRDHYLLEAHKEHPLVKSIIELLDLDKQKHAKLHDVLTAVLQRLEKGLPLGKEHDIDSMTKEEAEKASLEEIAKLRAANDEEGSVLKVTGRDGPTLSSRKFYRREYRVVLIRDRPIGDMNLDGIAYEVNEGDCSGDFETVSNLEITPQAAAKELARQGSDPGFLELDEDGNDLDEDGNDMRT